MVTRTNFPTVAKLIELLGAMPARSAVLGIPTRELHHDLATVAGVAENAIFAAERAPMTIVVKREDFDLVAESLPGAKPIPKQVREAMQEVSRLASERGDASAAHFLSGAAFLLDDADVLKLRNLLR